MNPNKTFTFALVGNPNAGKSSVFNQLTGLRQKVGNFPGVTVDKKVGTVLLKRADSEQKDSIQAHIIDLPGTYSLYPNSQDERIVLNILSNPNDADYPDAIIYVADLTNLERHLLLFTQLKDLNLPIVLCINMIDVAAEQGIFVDKNTLSELCNIEVVTLNGRTGEGIEDLKMAMSRLQATTPPPQYKMFYQPNPNELKAAENIRLTLPKVDNTYRAILLAHHYWELPFVNGGEKLAIKNIVETHHFEDLRLQITETLQRFDKLRPILEKVFIKNTHTEEASLTDKIDKVLTHHIAGPIIFFATLFLIFQSIFALASFPMDWIEGGFNAVNSYLKNHLPNHVLTDLLTDGVIAGLSGVLVFIPQIAILFFLISLLEEVGYMARTVYLFDRIMQKVGLNGRSIVALVSGGACAIPAIMSTRTISNWKERLITILVTPLISCSARIPVYALLVAFVVPANDWKGFNLQGLVFAGLYVLGVVAALAAAWVFKKILKSNESTFLAIELPEYRLPHWKNVFYTVFEKVKSFVTEAGKIIIIVSIGLWFLASFGPGDSMRIAEDTARKEATEKQMTEQETADYIASQKLQVSYAGHLGKAFEPAIRPLGFDWKIGIALISSFAAREVFVGTMATIYSIGSAGEDESTIREQMKKEKREDGTPLYSMATALSLLIFYVFAMQCMSTLAVVKRETQSWKWVIVQFTFMSVLAYVGSWIVFNIFK